MNKRLMLQRKGPDALTEELVNVVSNEVEFEFKPLFTLVYANLRARNAAHGGEEMLRLRLYEKLQWLVQVGGVEKTGKTYRGNSMKLRPILELLVAKRCRDLIEVARLAPLEAESTDAGLGSDRGPRCNSQN
ncbi:MAG: hypothetical protein ABJF10_12470 [Chthoniobacter sp.]|uniref:hypothetical protein n=1 Tax=Chthoniobacter sp. TaxID=2510640 RepID=UPI0032ACFE5A